MIFYNYSSPPPNAQYPCITLGTDNWNDYGYVTTFYVKYYDEEGLVLDLDTVKILTAGNYRTQLPQTFTNLDDSFCSLGQTLDYYEKISQLQNSEEILESLNDVVIKEDIRDFFSGLEGFKSSLLRNSEARLAINQAQIYFEPESNIPEIPIRKFTFKTRLPLAESDHIIDFDFESNEFLPFRINALIGKNGAGKTEVLSRIANSLSGIAYSDSEFTNGGKPLVNRIITISYSPFDDFKRVISRKGISYNYCGLKDAKGNIDLKLSQNQLIKAYKDILDQNEKNKVDIWREILLKAVNEETLERFEDFLNNPDKSKLSSGQNMILSILTQVVSFIRPKSFILFDEPELNLHPNAITGLIGAIYHLLERFDSYCIISTHSSVVLQEIPSKYVRVFRRIGNRTNIKKLSIECFAENLTVITNEVFGVDEDKSRYKEIFENIAKNKSYYDALELFDDKLSLNARIFLKSLYEEEEL